jgi:Cu+-exporting ATPase
VTPGADGGGSAARRRAPAPAAPRCARCGLPVRLRRGAAAREPFFCCLGCALLDQVAGGGARGEPSRILARLGLAVFLTMQVMGVSMVLYAGDPLATGGPGPAGEMTAAGEAGATAAAGGPGDPLHLGLTGILRHLLLLLSAPVMALLGWPVMERGLADLRRRGGGVDTLIALGAFAAFLLSATATLRGRGAVYFETACMTLVLLTLGRYLEARARGRAADALRGGLAAEPVTALLLRDGVPREVPAGAVRPGETVRVLPGTRVPVDGVVTRGEGGVDESSLTGEPAPALKRPGDPIYAATTSLDGSFDVRVTASGSERLAARIAALLERARGSRAPIEMVADRVAGLFVPAAAAAAVVAGLAWTARAGPGAGVLTALAVLLIACPCALGLATPLAVWSAIGRAAGRGIIIRDAETLERLAAARAACFDKTGTLTDGRPRLRSLRLLPGAPLDEDEALAVGAALERHASHPLARALEAEAERRRVAAIAARQPRVHPGLGVEAVIDLPGRPAPRRAAIGGRRLMRRLGVDPGGAGPAGEKTSAGGPACLLALDGRVAAVLEFAETVRPGAAGAVAALRRQGLAVEILTGDPGPGAAAVGGRLGVPVRSGLTPAGKVERIEATERTRGPVIMVGDGLNDAPAAARAHVSVALGCGDEVTRRAADVALLGDDPAQVAWLAGLARRTLRAVRVNLFWAFAYNAALIPVAMTGRLQPILAALAMIGSSLFVVGNSLRLGRGREAAASGPAAIGAARPAEVGAR